MLGATVGQDWLYSSLSMMHSWTLEETEKYERYIVTVLFALIGNLTYVMPIFANSPVCYVLDYCRPGEAASIYGRYILVSLSWLPGSFGTLLLDMGIFVQFFLHRVLDDESSEKEESAIAN